MRIRYSRRFERRFRRLSYADKKATLEVIANFLEHPGGSLDISHALRGRMTRQRSLPVDPDLRIIFAVKGEYDDVLFLDIGTHAEVYRS